MGEALPHELYLGVKGFVPGLTQHVVHPYPDTLARNEPRVFEVREMTGYFRLRFVEDVHDVADAELAMSEEHDDPQPDLLRKGPKILNQSIHEAAPSPHHIISV